MVCGGSNARLYWTWAREAGPGLSSVEVPLEVCEQALRLDEAVPLEGNVALCGNDLVPDVVVLEVRHIEGAGRLPAGFYRLAERRYDAAIQQLLNRG